MSIQVAFQSQSPSSTALARPALRDGGDGNFQTRTGLEDVPPRKVLRREVDVLVIGAGQAGLATAVELKRAGLTFEIHDGARRVGDSWRNRPDSLILFSPRRYSALPGLALPGDPDGLPGKDEIADYLERYAHHHGLSVQLGSSVRRLQRTESGFAAETSRGETLLVRAVVSATGAFQIPEVPSFARRLDARVTQLTAASYRNPASVPAGRVLVVGDGASGRQIALELAASREVLLACGRKRRITPRRLFGRDIFRWLDASGVLRADRASMLGRLMRRADPIPCPEVSDSNLRKAGVSIVPRVTSVEGDTVSFADGRAARVDAVIWALGYRDDTSWIAVPEALDERSRVREDRGRSPVQGLFFAGRPWQNNRSSALLCGAGEEGARAAAAVSRFLAAGGARGTGAQAVCEGAVFV